MTVGPSLPHKQRKAMNELSLTPVEAEALMVAIENYERKALKDYDNNPIYGGLIRSNLMHLETAKRKLQESRALQTYYGAMDEMLNLKR